MSREEWKEGYQAYFNNRKLDDNPYNTDEEYEKWQSWKDGWYEAAWDS